MNANGAIILECMEEEAQALDRGRYLSNFEAHEILKRIRESGGAQRTENLRMQLDKAVAYTENFARFTNEFQLEAAKASIRDALRKQDSDDEDHKPMTEADSDEMKRREEYDTVTMLNLCPTTIRAARAYIPALKRKKDDEIQEMLNELDRLRQ